MLTTNRAMLTVFRTAGFAETTQFDGSVIEVELLIEPGEEARAAIEHREHKAEAASVARLLTPRSVAVVGAGRNPESVGHVVVTNLQAAGFAGPIHPINPRATEIAGLPASASLVDIPGPVDLAVVAVPAGAVLDVVRDAIAKGVHGLVVLTAGFSEVGDHDAQDELRDLARGNGLRLIGPNCIGVVNTAIGLDATFSPFAPVPGRIAMQSQSGALGIALLERSSRMGLGVSSFVSVGNKADVSGNDLLQYWEDDPGTDVVLLYLESFGNPHKFARIARRVSRRKPIVAVKSGRSSAGVRAASSHTAAMASPDVAVDALFRQTGVIRVDTLDELFDMALLLGAQPLPAGNRVAIVGNSGGPMILATDACVGEGLEVPELSPATQTALRAMADPNAAVDQPRRPGGLGHARAVRAGPAPRAGRRRHRRGDPREHHPLRRSRRRRGRGGRPGGGHDRASRSWAASWPPPISRRCSPVRSRPKPCPSTPHPSPRPGPWPEPPATPRGVGAARARCRCCRGVTSTRSGPWSTVTWPRTPMGDG